MNLEKVVKCNQMLLDVVKGSTESFYQLYLQVFYICTVAVFRENAFVDQGDMVYMLCMYYDVIFQVAMLKHIH